jgi:hypothetical protein
MSEELERLTAVVAIVKACKAEQEGGEQRGKGGEGRTWRRRRERGRKRKQGNLIVVSSRVGSSTSKWDTIEFYGVHYRVRGSLHVVQNLGDGFGSAFLRFYVSLARHYQTRKQIRESKRNFSPEKTGKTNKAMFFTPDLSRHPIKMATGLDSKGQDIRGH